MADSELPRRPTGTGPIARSVQLLAQASAAVSLFAVGGMLVGLRPGGMLDDLVVSIAGKLVVQPLVALGLLFALPALVIFLLLQRHVTSGFAAGAVKG